MKKVVSLSGGKDSTCMLLMMLEKGIPFDEVIFCDTGLEFPQLYEHLDKLEKNTGIKITRLKSDISFEDYFLRYKRAEKSPYKDIEGLGWPAALRRWCTSYLKTCIVDKYFERERERASYVYWNCV